MAYFDADDCRARLRAAFDSLYRLPDEAGDLDADIADVHAIVDAYVGKRYAIPVTVARAIAMLKTLSLDLFEERAWARGAGEEIPKKVTLRADVARKQLERIANGTITLAGATALTERQTGGADAVVVSGNSPEFTRTQMGGY